MAEPKVGFAEKDLKKGLVDLLDGWARTVLVPFIQAEVSRQLALKLEETRLRPDGKVVARLVSEALPRELEDRINKQIVEQVKKGALRKDDEEYYWD